MMLRIDLSDYIGLLNAFSDEIVMAPLHGINKVALISVNSGAPKSGLQCLQSPHPLLDHSLSIQTIRCC
jgi:hypothetical protein